MARNILVIVGALLIADGATLALYPDRIRRLMVWISDGEPPDWARSPWLRVIGAIEALLGIGILLSIRFGG